MHHVRLHEGTGRSVQLQAKLRAATATRSQTPGGFRPAGQGGQKETAPAGGRPHPGKGGNGSDQLHRRLPSVIVHGASLLCSDTPYHTLPGIATGSGENYQSFIAGFRLAWGIAAELSTDSNYSYDQEQAARFQEGADPDG